MIYQSEKNAVPENRVEQPIQETAKVSPSLSQEVNNIIAVLKTGFNAVVKEQQANRGELKLLREELMKSNARLTALEKHASSQKEDVRSILGNVATADANIKRIDGKLFVIQYCVTHDGPIYPAGHSVPGIPEEVGHEQSA